MIDRSVLMIWSKPVLNDIEKGAVRKFADAIGDPNPLFRDEEVAKHSRYGRLLAPPTFAMTLEYGDLPGLLLPQEGLIHGEQTFYYSRPLFVGEAVYCLKRLTDVYVRGGATGKMTFLLFETRCADERDQTIQSAKMNIIIRGGEGA